MNIIYTEYQGGEYWASTQFLMHQYGVLNTANVYLLHLQMWKKSTSFMFIIIKYISPI